MPSVYPVRQTDVQQITIVTNPFRTYSSSSIYGATGSVYVFPRRSPFLKDATPDSSFVDSVADDGGYPAAYAAAQNYGSVTSYQLSSSMVSGSQTGSVSSSFYGIMDQYLAACDAEGQQLRLQEVLDVIRFTPTETFTSDTLRKLVIKDQLNPFYRTVYPSAQYAYTNYNTLNFFTASGFPTSSCLLFPNIPGDLGGLGYNAGHVGGTYTPSGAFSLDFYINPRYQQDQPHVDFKAGTILHLSSTLALSLVTGSSVDVNGRAQGFKLLLQLTHSADIPPSRALPGAYPADLVFFSSDNSLLLNHWHHVVVRWGTDQVNGGLGTFNIDGLDAGTFLIPSSTIAPALSDTQGGPDVLCVGNFYEGPNVPLSGNLQAAFFATDPATRDGLNVLLPEEGIEVPPVYAFNHPLNAELHDVAIRRCYMSDTDIQFSASQGPTFLDNTVAFYLPPFFVTDSPYRQFVNDHGGLLITPFEEVDGATTTPFSVALSFGIGGHYINLENFVKDFGSNNFAMLHHLTGIAIQGSTDLETCDQFLYSQSYVAKRNLTILPCDDGLFVPGFQLLSSESSSRAVDDLGMVELSFINLDDLVATASLLLGPGTGDDGSDSSSGDSLAGQLTGVTPETPFAAAGPAVMNYANTVSSGSDVEAGAPLTIFQRTQDPSSNEVTVFDISNLFYGFRISPTTLSIQDPDLISSTYLGANVPFTGSGPIRITLADDGYGNVYRADCVTSQSSWNSVGNLYYDEGLLLVKSPHLFFFGESSYSLSFQGEQHVHTMRIDVLAPANQLNSSSNPSYLPLPPTGYPNDTDDAYVNITGINFHDTDFNVVMKSSLAQPILKRTGNRILFKTRVDF